MQTSIRPALAQIQTLLRRVRGYQKSIQDSYTTMNSTTIQQSASQFFYELASLQTNVKQKLDEIQKGVGIVLQVLDKKIKLIVDYVDKIELQKVTQAQSQINYSKEINCLKIKLQQTVKRQLNLIQANKQLNKKNNRLIQEFKALSDASQRKYELLLLRHKQEKNKQDHHTKKVQNLLNELTLIKENGIQQKIFLSPQKPLQSAKKIVGNIENPEIASPKKDRAIQSFYHSKQSQRQHIQVPISPKGPRMKVSRSFYDLGKKKDHRMQFLLNNLKDQHSTQRSSSKFRAKNIGV